MEALFGEPLVTYTSQQAVEDGVLVAITRRDFVTRTMWQFLVEHTPLVEPPNCWPIDLMGWIGATRKLKQKKVLELIAKHGEAAQAEYEGQVRHDLGLALCRGLLARDSGAATRAEGAGHIYELWIDMRTTDKGHVIVALCEARPSNPHAQVVLIRPNECGGVTAMFPEDN